MPHISKSKRIGYQSSDVEGKKIDEDVRKSIEELLFYLPSFVIFLQGAAKSNFGQEDEYLARKTAIR